MLMKAERQTMTMVRTPTRVLFSLDWTIPLERLCRGTGKSCGQPNGQVVSLGAEKILSRSHIIPIFRLLRLNERHIQLFLLRRRVLASC